MMNWRGPAAGARRLLGLLLPLVAAGRLAGQARSPARFEVVVDAGLTGNAAAAFSEDQICTSGAALSAGARLRGGLGRWIGVEIVGQLFSNFSVAACMVDLIPPPPQSGPYTYQYDFYDASVVGYPFAATGVRVQLVPLRGGAAEVRAWGGLSRLWAKRITVPQAGLTALLGRRRVRALLEADTWWYRVPRHEVTLHYLDGQLVSRQDGVSRVQARTIVFRAGVVIPLGRPHP
ncbi:MAG TPA: hypothetical protein VLB49_16710 [Gemmatimonadales bacterium]|nr:hypothetical protein [Gemmatimonadales bacterium]